MAIIQWHRSALELEMLIVVYNQSEYSWRLHDRDSFSVFPAVAPNKLSKKTV